MVKCAEKNNPKNMSKSTVLFLSLTIFAFGCGPEATAPEAPIVDEPVTQATMKTKPEEGDTIAVFTTNHGEFSALLYTELVPKTTENFVELAKQGKYDGVPFHRVIKDFMIQGGDFENKNGTGGYTFKGPGTAINDEFGEGLRHLKGALSMANAGPNTGASQFFVVQAEGGTPWLDGAHSIFGFVYDGMDVIDEIALVETAGADTPVKEVLLEKMEITEFK